MRSPVVSIGVMISVAFASLTQLMAQPTAGPAAAATPPATLTPSQTTAMAAIGTTLQAQTQALTEARTALTRSAFAEPPDPTDLRAKVQALASAELALANAWSDQFTRVQEGESKLNVEQTRLMVGAAATSGALTGRAGGRGALAGGAAGRGGAGAGAGGRGGGAVLEGPVTNYYTIETIMLPEGETSTDAVAFLPDGRLICTLSLSKVYIYDLQTRRWSLFAEGLHTPLGLLPLSNTEILVMQRPELTLMVDRNGDGKADQFKTVSDYFGMSGNYAEFVSGPVKDAQGNLYYGLGTGSDMGNILTDEVRGFYSPQGHIGRMNSPVPYRGWIMKVTPDGKTIPWADGFREPNGIGLDPEGNLFSIDNQGDWVGSSKLFHIRQNGFYGHAPDLVWRSEYWGGKQPLDAPVPELDKLRTREAVIFPHGEMANSPGQPLWDTTGGKFGPFAGQMFIGDMDRSRIMRVMLEKVEGEFQGAVAPFFENGGLHAGNNRLVFNSDGSLWVGQTKHQAWVGESGLQHITWKGVVPMEVKMMNLTEDGFNLTFTKPVDPVAAAKVESYRFQNYFYNYHETYGSQKFEQKEIVPKSVEVSADRMRVALHLGELTPWTVYDLRLSGISSRDGLPLLNPWLVYNLNRLLHNTPPPPQPIDWPRPTRRTPVMPPGGVKSIGGPQDFPPSLPAAVGN